MSNPKTGNEREGGATALAMTSAEMMVETEDGTNHWVSVALDQEFGTWTATISLAAEGMEPMAAIRALGEVAAKLARGISGPTSVAQGGRTP